MVPDTPQHLRIPDTGRRVMPAHNQKPQAEELRVFEIKPPKQEMHTIQYTKDKRACQHSFHFNWIKSFTIVISIFGQVF